MQNPPLLGRLNGCCISQCANAAGVSSFLRDLWISGRSLQFALKSMAASAGLFWCEAPSAGHRTAREPSIARASRLWPFSWPGGFDGLNKNRIRNH
jgi:hypothetical protein